MARLEGRDKQLAHMCEDGAYVTVQEIQTAYIRVRMDALESCIDTLDYGYTAGNQSCRVSLSSLKAESWQWRSVVDFAN